MGELSAIRHNHGQTANLIFAYTRNSDLVFKIFIACLLLVRFISNFRHSVYLFFAFTQMNLLTRVGLPFNDHEFCSFSPLSLPLLFFIYCILFLISFCTSPLTSTGTRAPSPFTTCNWYTLLHVNTSWWFRIVVNKNEFKKKLNFEFRFEDKRYFARVRDYEKYVTKSSNVIFIRLCDDLI